MRIIKRKFVVPVQFVLIVYMFFVPKNAGLAVEIITPNVFTNGEQVSLTLLNENFDKLYSSVNEWLPIFGQEQIIQAHALLAGQPANADHLNANFEQLRLAMNLLLSELQQGEIPILFQLKNGQSANASQINQIFDAMISAANFVSLSQNFEGLYDKLNGWLIKVNQPEMTKPESFLSCNELGADQVNQNFDQLYAAVNYLLIGRHQPAATKPYHFIDSTQCKTTQLNQNFIVLFSATNELDTFFNGIVERRIPDTGQTTCYNNITEPLSTCPAPGEPLAQDGSYTINPPSYSDNGNGTVTDNITNLIWQQTDDNTKRTWDLAVNYCESNVAGLPGSDWRLPNARELASIHDLEKFDYAINNAFSISDEMYWSSTTIVDSIDLAHIVRFYDGDLSMGRKTDKYYVRCVRGGEIKQSNAFFDNTDGTVTDLSSGLTWQQDESSTMVWEYALNYCETESNFGGNSNWRLPNINELESLFNYSKTYPSIDQTFFPNIGFCRHCWYWSSTTRSSNSFGKWVARFDKATTYYTPMNDEWYVRCVRGGQ